MLISAGGGAEAPSASARGLAAIIVRQISFARFITDFLSGGLVAGADAIACGSAAGLARTAVNVIASAIGRSFKREHRADRQRRSVHSIADGGSVLVAIYKDAGHCTRGDIDHVVR